MIEIYDNLIPKFLQDKLENITLSKPKAIDFPYYFINNIDISNPESNSDFGFTHPLYSLGSSFSSEFTPLFNQILYIFCGKQKINILKTNAGRVFFQPPSKSPKTLNSHKDLFDKDNNFIPHWVCLYYVNDTDGDTIFYKNDKKTEIKRVTPKKGRIIFFDGNIFHAGSSPQKNHRVILNFNFIGEFYK